MRYLTYQTSMSMKYGIIDLKEMCLPSAAS